MNAADARVYGRALELSGGMVFDVLSFVSRRNMQVHQPYAVAHHQS